jgi:ribosome maturation factor RimP
VSAAVVDRLQHVRDIAERVAATMGLEIFDVQLRRESIGWVLRVVLDKPATQAPELLPVEGEVARRVEEDGVTIEDCQKMSHELGAILDVEEAIDVAYTLEVSSPGLDRPLRHADDYRRFAGRLAKVVVTEAIDGNKHFTGRLRGIEDDQVVLADTRGRERRIPLASVARARLEVEF